MNEVATTVYRPDLKHHSLIEYTDEFYRRPDDGFSGTKDTVDSVVAALKWTQYFDLSSSWKTFAAKSCDTFDPLSQGFSIPAFFTRCNRFRHEVVRWNQTDDWRVDYDLFTSAALTANSGSEAVMFLDSIHIIHLKNWANIAKGVFWSAAFALDFVDYFVNISRAEDLMQIIQKTKHPAVKEFYEHRLDFTFLKIIQNVTTIALASLMLVSIFFAAVAEGYLFAPITLGLTTAWLALNLILHYYDRILQTQENNFLPGVLEKI